MNTKLLAKAGLRSWLVASIERSGVALREMVGKEVDTDVIVVEGGGM